ncbi:glycosyltransferase family 39 protein [Azohydromonas australica]|uniref:glycosyltransferase family 39 protein n=1 Tax=Azohydromonas australica TaxID=364039 RepID=UPI00041A9172|nr:glycosyltransferase family 39 protein [Azohydromonas australica]
MKPLSRNLSAHGPCLLALLAFAALLFLNTPTDGDFWWFDASRHAMNSVFIRDLLLEGGLLHPIDFARNYYQQYPGLTIGFYPPLFYLSAAPWLALFGVHHAVNQAVVVLYALLGGSLVYLLCVRHMGRLAATATALCVLAMPDTALWSRQVQLDVPAIALMLASAYGLIRYLETDGSPRWLLFTTLGLGLAILTRVQAIFAIPVLLFFLFADPRRPRIAMKPRLKALALMLLVALPSLLIAAYFSRVNQTLAGEMPGMPKLLSLENWIWYARALPRQMGLPALGLLVAGLVAGALTWRRPGWPPAVKVLAALALCAWGFFTLVSNKDPRFNLPGVVLLFVASALLLYLALPRLARLALPALACWLVVQALALSEVPVVGGFKEAALLAQEITPHGGNVLVSARRDGSFIFNMRTLGERRDMGVRRADKMFVDMKIAAELGVKDRALDVSAIERLLKDENIQTVVAQPGYLASQPSFRSFGQVLEAGVLYEPVRRIRITGATPANEQELVVYRRK